MKFSYSWLQDYLKDLPSPEELASDLTALGTEVEEITGRLDDKIVAAKIVNIEPHPNADKLRIATIDDGSEKLQIVCGAPNIEAGQKVPLARIGARINGLEIKEVEIRGVKSFGMLCSEKELGLGQDHTGIMLLDDRLPLGSKLSSVSVLDVVFQTEVTPNRGDLLSHLGIARELAAKYKKSIQKEPISLSMSSHKTSGAVSVNIEDKSCSKYYARVIKHLKVGDSPDWLKNRLTSIGLKPVNNIVDVTNYIMYDIGQPLHAFDYDKVEGRNIVVRKAEKNEPFIALDAKKYRLTENDLVIADSKRPIALAGIMGGQDSAIGAETQDIVLEAAVFNAVNIRRSSKQLGISSDASYRFERGIDSSLVEYAINKAANLIKEVAGGNILSGIVKNETNIPANEVNIEYDKINNLLGLKLTEEEINQYLRRLCFEVHDGFATVPAFRHDIGLWQDLAEEVGRLYGSENLKHLPLPKSEKPRRSDYFYQESLKDKLVFCGLTESISYPFVSSHDVAALDIDIESALEVKNPVQPENKYLRQSLFGGLAKLTARNSSFPTIYTFEIGRVFNKKSETTKLGLMLAGQNQKEILAIIETIKKHLPVPDPVLVDQSKFRYKFRKNFVYFVESDISSLGLTVTDIVWPKKEIVYRQVSKYPSANRDIAIIVDEKINSEDINKSIFDSSNKVNRVELFDEFRSEKLGAGKKSLAFHLDLQDLTKTLTDQEADDEIKKIINKLSKYFGAKLRS